MSSDSTTVTGPSAQDYAGASPAQVSKRLFNAIRAGNADRPGMTRAIEMTQGIHTIGSIWLTGCALFISFSGA